MELMETNEQKLMDEQFNLSYKKKEYAPSMPTPIDLKKKMDLKHRQLINQIRDILACRNYLNEMIKNYENLRNVSII